MKLFKIIPLLALLFITISCTQEQRFENSISKALENRNGCLLFIDLETGEKIYANKAKASELFAPCSTFKIWNTLIGVECGLLNSADQPFYKWDGEKRFLDSWNRDQTLKEGFQSSCVPAYQGLARKIGPARMQEWLNRINYGNRDIASGIDIFWLPREGEQSILISVEEQAELIRKLLAGELPFSQRSRDILKEIMLYKDGANGTLYGKTGSGQYINGKKGNNIGWFVGYWQGAKKGYAFACLLEGEGLSGLDAKALVRGLLEKNKML